MDKLAIDSSLATILDSISEGVNIINTDGIIIFGNKAYCEFLGLSREELIGKKLKDIRPNAMLPDIVAREEKLLHVERNENGESYFVNLYPIYSNGKVIGGISIVTFIDAAFDFKKQIEQLEKKMEKRLIRINKANRARYKFDSITTINPHMIEIKNMAMQVAKTDMTVLLQSETGTGKELFANAIHNESLRKDEVFIAINCANFNAELLDSELFGYVEGAFTGAKKGGKMGLFEAANKGTLFLDEISEMDISLQSKLLRALQEKRIRPIGGVEDIPIDVRIICASNADLKEYVAKGKFRADLYYRLNICTIKIPPLRERIEDIEAIVKEQLKQISQKLKREISIDKATMEVLKKYHWPGNVRELINVLEFSSFKAKNGVITVDCLPELTDSYNQIEEDQPTLADRVRQFEKREILKELRKYGNSTEAKKIVAKKLGISLASLYNKLAD